MGSLLQHSNSESDSPRESPYREFLGAIKRNWRTVFILITVAVDSLVIVAANLAAYGFYSVVAGAAWREPPPFFQSTLLIWSICIFLGLVFGLYRASFHTKIGAQYFLGAKVYLYSILTLLAILYIARFSQYHRTFLVMLFILIPPTFLLFRAGLNKFNLWMQRRWGYGVFNALIVEYEDRLDEVMVNRFNSFPELGYRVRGHILKKKSGGKRATKEVLSRLPEVIRANNVDSIFIPTLDIIENGYAELISMCKSELVKLKVLSKESEDLLRFAYITDLAGVSLYAPPRGRTERLKRAAKRAFDIAGALIGIIVLSPLVALVTAAIYLEDGRPIYFSQRRGLIKGGKEFSFIKFRSMKKGSEEQQLELYKNNKATGGLFLIEDDPRLTRVGRLIRKYSVDEVPQLLNVLKGEMSLVGPRPLTVADLANITPENRLGGYYKLREQGKPGMTGLWQISGRREVGFREMVLLDLYYLENQTILFDLEILAQTIPVVLFGRGGY